MAKWEHVTKCQAPPHYPPPEVCEITKRTLNRRVRITEQVETPLDEFGRPDIVEMLRIVASSLDFEYEWPHATNVHHLAHTRRSYEEAGDIPLAYRRSPSLMVNLPVQTHNMIHGLFEIPPMPSLDVMREHVIEQKRISTLFTLGRDAVKFTRWSQEIADGLQEGRYDNMRRMGEVAYYYANVATFREMQFYDRLDSYDKGELGLMPEPTSLAELPLAEATNQLAKLGAVRFRDMRHTSQEFVHGYGRSEEKVA